MIYTTEQLATPKDSCARKWFNPNHQGDGNKIMKVDRQLKVGLIETFLIAVALVCFLLPWHPGHYGFSEGMINALGEGPKTLPLLQTYHNGVSHYGWPLSIILMVAVVATGLRSASSQRQVLMLGIANGVVYLAWAYIIVNLVFGFRFLSSMLTTPERYISEHLFFLALLSVLVLLIIDLVVTLKKRQNAHAVDKS